jgi:hypothetical protein
MTHFGDSATLSRTTPTEWLSVGARVGRLVNQWAERHDLVAYIGDQAGSAQGAPALFTPATGEVEVNTNIAFPGATPEQIGDLTERVQQFEFPKGTGAIFHEALHARFSTFDIMQAQRDLNGLEWEGFYLLEEGRIEAFGVRLMPQNKAFLRACALGIVLGDLKDVEAESISSVRGIAKLMALSCARVQAGVLTNEDIEPLTDIFDVIAPKGLFEELRPLWTQFQILDPKFALPRMYDLARKWAEIVSKYAEEAGEDAQSESGKGEGGEGSEGNEEARQIAQQIMGALAEAAESTEFEATAEAMDQQTAEENEEVVQSRASQAQARKQSQKVANQVFSHASGPSGVKKTSSRLMAERLPSPIERASAVRIGQALERAKYRDRIRTESASATPPGRLRTRAVVQGRAMRARGVMDTTAPWNRVQRKHVDDPNLTIGVMVDISGSMRSAMEPLASAAWILSEATRRVHGRTAMVYYGDDVFPTLKAGQHLDKVRVYSASDSTEEFGKAFQALDGALDLLNGSGARLLVVVSDGHYRGDQQQIADDIVRQCDRAGVAVLWLGVGAYGKNGERYCTTPSSSYVPVGESVTDAADQIGRLAQRALTTAGSRV